MAKEAKPGASSLSCPSSTLGTTSSRGDKDVQSAIDLAQDDRGARLARFLSKRKNVFKPEMESAQARQTRLTLEDENFHLSAELRRLDALKRERWHELVKTNQWTTHEEDEICTAIEEQIQQTCQRQSKVYSLLKENKDNCTKRLLEELARTTGKEAAGKLMEQRRLMDRGSEYSPLTLQSSSVDWEEPEENEELDYLFLVKVKKGEGKLYTQFLLNNDTKVWE